ncbi:MAG: hypothetical protein WC997_08635 [Porticoccaceae bacterium]
MIDASHDANHYPEDESDVGFQESWALTWLDPVSRIAGWHHFGMQRVSGITDVNSYISQAGHILGRHVDLTMPMPDGDFTRLDLGSIQIESLEPLKKHAVTIEHGRARVNLVMEAFVGPFFRGHREAPSHWESFGEVTGTAAIDGRIIPLKGLAFQDRSWGSRNLGSLVACRLVTAIFGADLIFRIFEMTYANDRQVHGLVIDNGVHHEIAHAELVAGMAGDALNISDIAARLWTVDARGYLLSGTSLDNDIQENRDGKVSIQGNFIYECGGRQGVGFVVDLRGMTEEHRNWIENRYIDNPGFNGT